MNWINEPTDSSGDPLIKMLLDEGSFDEVENTLNFRNASYVQEQNRTIINEMADDGRIVTFL